MATQAVNASNALNNNGGVIRLGGNISSSLISNIDLGANPQKQQNLPFGFTGSAGISAEDDIQAGIDLAKANRTNAVQVHKFPQSLTILSLENKTRGSDVVEQLRDGRFWSSTTQSYVLRTAINNATVTTNAEAAPVSTFLNGKLIYNGA